MSLSFDNLDFRFRFLYDAQGCLEHKDDFDGEVSSADLERRAWTILECDDVLYLVHGIHHVNRFSYLISQYPCTENIEPVPFED